MTDMITEFGSKWTQIFLIDFGRYFIAAAAVTVLIWAFRRWTGARRIQNRRADFNDRRREFGHSFTTVMIFAVNGVGVWTLERTGMIVALDIMPSAGLFLAELVLMVVIHDAYFYWMHRGLHTRLMFRRAHATHHVSRTPTPWAAYSFAPIEAMFEAVFMPLYLLIFPAHGITIAIFLVHQILRNSLGHSGHELAWSGFTRSRWTGWLTTTVHHDLHHSEGRHNFGLYFTWWDRWMATEHPDYHDRFEAVVTRNSGQANAVEKA